MKFNHLYEPILFYNLNNLRQVFCTFHLFIMAIMKDLKKTTVKKYDWVYSYSSPKEEKTAVFFLKRDSRINLKHKIVAELF